MLRKSLLALSLFLPIASASVQAQTFGQLYRNVNVTSIGVQHDTLGNTQTFWIDVSGTYENNPTYTKPACHTGSDKRVFFDLKDSSSDAMLSLMMSAYHTGTKIDLDTYGACLNSHVTVRNAYFSPGQ